MGYENQQHIGLVEKASQLAIKHGIVYSAKEGVFKGDLTSVTKATEQLRKWQVDEGMRQRRAESSW